MRYAPEYNVAFIHIPKNAGQSVRNALAAATPLSYAALADDLDISDADAAIAVERGMTHRRLGPIHPAHLPLHLLAEKLPVTWATLQGAHSFALTRAPRDRFISALMQRLKEFRGAGDIRAEDAVVRDEAKAVCDWLAARERFHDLSYIHFTRQTAFTDLAGQRVLKAVFPVDRMDALSAWLKAEAGLQIEIAHEHARRQPKPWARRIVPAARLAARTLMPRPVRRVLHPLWTGSKVFDNAASGYGKLDLGPEVEGFIADYYAGDAALHAEAQAAAKAVLLAEAQA